MSNYDYDYLNNHNQLEENKKKFVHFGCWNNDMYTKVGNNPISKVLNTLIKEKSKYDFFGVAGDSYYPTKEKNQLYVNGKTKKTKTKKIKFYNKTALKAGFNALKELGKDVFLLLGNHEVEPVKRLVYIENKKHVLTKNNIIKIEGTNEPNTAIILRNQLEASKDCHIRLNEVMKVIDNTVIFFINSMFFTDEFLTDKHDTSCTNLLNNYKQNKNIPLKTKKENIRNKEIQKLYDALENLSNKSQFRNVIIIGHEPIIEHEGDKMPKQIFNKIGVITLLNIYGAFSNAKNYYLCADVHMYQKSQFTMKATGLYNEKEVSITQYVVGTGGATLQKKGEATLYNKLNLSGINLNKNLLQMSNKHLQKKSLPNIESYLLDKDASKYTHGYLECDYSTDNLEFTFVDCMVKPAANMSIITPVNGGGKKIKSIKKPRRHQGIYQRGPKKGKLKPGFKYSGKKTKTGLRIIIKFKK